MNDFLLNLSSNPAAKKVIKSLNLPIPLPQPLKRGKGALTDKPLEQQNLAVKAPLDALHGAAITEILQSSGAAIVGEGDLNGVVLDATGITSPHQLTEVYLALKPHLRQIRNNGRIVVVGSAQAKTPSASACQAGINGLVRSLAKECGKRGTTVNSLFVDTKSDAAQLAAPLQYFMSQRSAFVTGQSLTLSALVEESSAPRVQNLQGKRALVTGAAQGIGAAIAKRLSEEGAEVILLDRPAESETLAKAAAGCGGTALEVDLLQEDAVASILAEAGARGFDIVVNNAGITRDKKLANMKQDAWETTIQINLGVVEDLCSKLIKKGLNEGGRLICLSSIAGIAGNMGQTNYATAKAGIVGMVGAMAPAAAKRNITINAIAPGFIETRMTRAIPLAIREVARRFNTLSQGGQPEDIAEAAVFFASSGSYGVTGRTLRVCGQNLIGA